MSDFEPLDASGHFPDNTTAVCIGSGRFLRSVLVPILRSSGNAVIVAQTRSRSFADACLRANGRYEVDVMHKSGSVQTECVQLAGVGSLGTSDSRNAFMGIPSKLPNLRFIGFGVTESGLQRGSQAILDLTDFLQACTHHLPDNSISIINTDNMPANGDVIKKLVCEEASSEFQTYLDSKVSFHNTMVDRIVAHRDGDDLVPLTEPWPYKTLVIEDLHNALRGTQLQDQTGVHIRKQENALQQDHMLKLNVANAVHTAMVYLMSVSRMKHTQDILDARIIRTYLDLLFVHDIKPGLIHRGVSEEEAQHTYDEWMGRVEHRHFGLITFWVTQNTMFKYRVRLVPSILVNIEYDEKYRPSSFMAFATAVLLRYMTPIHSTDKEEWSIPVFTGHMDPLHDQTPDQSQETSSWEYMNNLQVNLSTGTYDFMDGNDGRAARILKQATDALRLSSNGAKPKVGAIVSMVLSQVEGLDMSNPRISAFVMQVAALYERMLTSSAMEVLTDVVCSHSTSTVLSLDSVEEVVRERVSNVKVIDVHTHLFPPSHGQLMQWGINDLLTYHYLVAEFKMTSSMSMDVFNACDKKKQAELIWQHLFIDRSPLSEACRGVLTTLHMLGLDDLVEKRDLGAIQQWFDRQDPEDYVETVFRQARLKYVVMTNVPFDKNEAKEWLHDTDRHSKWNKYFKSALRVDQLLKGDWEAMGDALDELKLPHTMDGCRRFLLHWIDVMQPEYFMASVPHTFAYPTQEVTISMDEKRPNGDALLLKVLLPLAEEKKLPIALKFDAVRGLNASLGSAGDGLQPTNVDNLVQLCRNYPNVKFLVTFLSRVNQHQVAVVANKFSNLHLYGCWWYCNNPSIVDELTRMRIEILGTAFTSQHSDARVLDQLMYKWSHSRHVIATVMVDMYKRLLATGWKLTVQEVERDVGRLFGGSYQEFMQKIE